MRQRTPIADRLWPKVEKTDGCWNWTGNRDKLGYGRITSGGHAGRLLLVHRVAYELLVGPIPAGLALDHTCVNPSCVNPAHLEPVTQGENVRRANERLGRKPGPNATKTHCPQGHPYAGDNLVLNRRGHQVCRECVRKHSREHQRRKRAARKAAGLSAEPDSNFGTAPRLSHCYRGHPYEGDNVYVAPNGRRYCRSCNRLKQAAYRQRQASRI